ncbi:ATP-grasp domain-containing protein [Paenibacillus hexagrammi]|uniref:ATP-grasp domain-containing protein n=1 Tax=Paenibacillus hexagrammi TaxID=2908839 RepID=A0ABY3SRJ2_9BACL|nr:ATP-grasp domain-containing protein [Paenibacillus sp. YPD9-1]
MPLLRAVKLAISKLGGDRRLIGADVDPNCLGQHFVDDFWLMPRLSKLSIEELITYCSNQGIVCIIPTRDGELGYFASHKAALQAHGISVMVSNAEAVELCLDKLAFYEKLQALGYPVIPTALSNGDIGAECLVVKERYGAGSQSIGLNLGKEEAVLHAKMLNEPVFQPYIPGTEVSVDLYVTRECHAKGVIVRTRDLIVSGESQITTTIRNVALEQLCSKLAQELGLYGHVVMQVIIDATGQFHIIECNTRFGGASTLSIAAGLDTFYWFLLESEGNSLASYPFLRSAEEKKQIRYAGDLIL